MMESPHSQNLLNRMQNQHRGVQNRNTLESFRKGKSFGQDSFKDSSGAKLARVQDDNGSGAKLAKVQEDNLSKDKADEAKENQGDGEQLIKGQNFLTGINKPGKKHLEGASSQYKQQFLESLKSKELNNEVLNHNDIKMEMGESGLRLKSAEETSNN